MSGAMEGKDFVAGGDLLADLFIESPSMFLDLIEMLQDNEVIP